MPEVISAQEFADELVSGELAMTLVGMSNVGKSHWSTKLHEEAHFYRECCDDLIEADLKDVLAAEGYSGGIADVAKWMGQPYDRQFPEAQRTYLDLESKHLQQMIDDLDQHGPLGLGGNTVIDTTGSVVHTGQEICERLGELTTVVALEATPDMQQEMFELYIAEPKPVVWGDMYQPKPGESPAEALQRCYPNLLAHRTHLYAEMAHVVIARETSLELPDAHAFLDHVHSTLPD